MNKLELTRELANRLNIPHTQSIRYFNTLREVIISELEREEPVSIQGFGSFIPWEQNERPGRNPKNGDPCIIPKRMSVKFRPGKELRAVLNEKREGNR